MESLLRFRVSSFNQFSSKTDCRALFSLLSFISNFTAVMKYTELFLVSSLQIRLGKYPAGKMPDLVFDREKCRGGAINRRRNYAEVAIEEVLEKSSSGKFRKILKKATVSEFFLKK